MRGELTGLGPGRQPAGVASRDALARTAPRRSRGSARMPRPRHGSRCRAAAVRRRRGRAAAWRLFTCNTSARPPRPVGRPAGCATSSTPRCSAFSVLAWSLRRRSARPCRRRVISVRQAPMAAMVAPAAETMPPIAPTHSSESLMLTKNDSRVRRRKRDLAALPGPQESLHVKAAVGPTSQIALKCSCDAAAPCSRRNASTTLRRE